MNEDSGENFLARWSRRKRQAIDEDVTPEHVEERSVKPGAQEDSVPLWEDSDTAVLEDARDPDAETADEAPAKDFSNVDFEKLDYDSDYKSFMDKDVPQDVRNKALRKLWVSNPVLANMDGLDDYCEDYTDAAVCLPKGMMKTAYRYGRGFLSDEEVAEWEALGKPEVAAADEEHAPTSETDGETAQDPVVAESAAESEEAVDVDGEVDGSPGETTEVAGTDGGAADEDTQRA